MHVPTSSRGRQTPVDLGQSDAVVCDRESGTYALPEAIHEINHHGEHFDVTGPFQAARSPQVHPLLVQAGASAAGRRFAARHADVVFSVHRDRDAAAAFRTSLRTCPPNSVASHRFRSSSPV